MYLLHAVTVWFRRTFGWVLSPASWREIGVACALLAAGLLLWLFRQSIPALGQVILWSLWLLAGAILLRQGWLKLFGPVLFYDLVRSGRRGRHILMRVLYACLLLLVLVLIWAQFSTWVRYGGYGGMTPQQISRMTQTFFEWFMAIQLVAVLILTPAYVSGAIADEKNRRTLEFLLATDLRSRELVLSKLGARLGQLSLFVMTGLPILSILQFMGGVSPDMIVAGFVATAATMFGLAGISIFHSTYYKRPVGAIAITYLTLIAYIILSFLLLWFQAGVFGWNPMTGGSSIGPSLVPPFLDGAGITLSFIDPALRIRFDYVWLGLLEIVDKGIEIFNSGNLLFLLFKVKFAVEMNTLSGQLWSFVGNYAGFHLLLGVVCIFWSMFRLRPVALKQASQPKRARMRHGLAGLLGLRRPRIYGFPMVWKELHVEGGLRFNWLGWTIVWLIVIASFIPVLIILYAFVAFVNNRYGWGGYGWSPWDSLAQSMNVYIRFITVIVGSLLLLAVAVRASWSISGERDRQSMDSLLTTPLSSNQILAAKWLGAIASVRFGWLWLGAAFFLGLITMGLHPIALPLVVGEWFVYAAFVAILGCWFSLYCKTSLRATIWTLVWTGVLGVGHWLIWMCCGVLLLIAGGPGMDGGRELEYVAKLQGGLTPPVAMGYTAFSYVDFRHNYSAEHVSEMLIFSLIGTGFWLFAATALWVVASARFRSMTRRESDLLPEYQRLPEVRPKPVPPPPPGDGVPEERIKQIPENITAAPPPFYDGDIELLGEASKPPPVPDTSEDADKNES